MTPPPAILKCRLFRNFSLLDTLSMGFNGWAFVILPLNIPALFSRRSKSPNTRHAAAEGVVAVVAVVAAAAQ